MSGSYGSVVAAPPPQPKSPPDLYGKRREFAKLQMLQREISFLEEELKCIESLEPAAASASCKELVDFVSANADPLIPTNKKIRRSCRFWKWLCGASYFGISWICCCNCSSRLEMPQCYKCVVLNCCCSPCSDTCCSSSPCSDTCCCSSSPCSNTCCNIPKCHCFLCWRSNSQSQCFKKWKKSNLNCCCCCCYYAPKCPSFPTCSSCTTSTCYPKCPKFNITCPKSCCWCCSYYSM